jgi:hypothetical protein
VVHTACNNVSTVKADRFSHWLHIWQGNGPVGQAETSPEILFVFRAYLLMIIQKISTANTLCKGAKNCSKLECTVQIRATAHARDCSAPSSDAVFRCAFQHYVDLRPQAFVTLAQFCLRRKGQTCEFEECANKPFSRCSWYKLNICFKHAIDVSYFCDSYNAQYCI